MSGIEIAPCAGLTMVSSRNLKEKAEAGKIRLSLEDLQAVREVADRADAAQGDRYPGVYMQTFADTPLP